jgi:hypothetical protein
LYYLALLACIGFSVYKFVDVALRTRPFGKLAHDYLGVDFAYLDIHGTVQKFHSIILDKVQVSLDYSNLINQDFLKVFSDRYGFDLPFSSFSNKDKIFDVIRHFDLKTQSDFFNCYVDFYKDNISSDILKFSKDLKTCVGLESDMSKYMNIQILCCIAVSCFIIAALCSTILSFQKKDVSVPLVFNVLGMEKGLSSFK